MTDLLRQAQRRYLWNLVLAQAAYVATAALAGLLLLLLLGTQVVDWYWLAVLAIGSALLLAWRFRHGLPSLYRLAQLLDVRLRSHDALSTAFHYREHPLRDSRAEEMRQHQLGEAEALSRGVSLAEVLPYRVPRSAYPMVMLAAVALGTFALRYGTTESLDLRAPLVSLDALARSLNLAPEPDQAARRQRRQQLAKLDGTNQLEGLSISEDQQPVVGDGQNPQDQPGGLREGNDGKPQPMNGEQGSPTGEQGQNGGEQDGAGEESPDSPQQGQSAAATPQGGSPGNQGEAQRQQERNSLLDKMRDAMANMMNKLNLPQPGQESPQTAQKGQQSQAGKQGQAQKGQKGQQKQGDGQQQDAENQQGEQEGDGQQQAQSMPSKDAGDQASRNSQSAKSGTGKQDGNKDLKDAEQLAAMGKISELLGRRAQNVAGEMTVEVPSGSQRLVTQYTRRSATHADAGAESQRDEIPLAYQQYVQSYFEQVHKQPAKK